MFGDGRLRVPSTSSLAGAGTSTQKGTHRCYCHRMKRSVDVTLERTAAVATALLLGLIARDDVGMSADMIRTDALGVACIIFGGSGSLLRRK
jgi:hypothetical protein